MELPESRTSSQVDKNEKSAHEYLAKTWLFCLGILGFELRSDPLEELTPILGPVAALESIGSSEELTEQLRQVRRQKRFIRNWIARENDRKKISEALDLLEDHIAAARHRAQQAELILKEHGFQFNANKGIVEAIPMGNRPEELINRAIRCVYDYLVRSGKTKGKVSKEVRQLISSYLSSYFPPEMLGAERKGPIDRAILNQK